MFCTVKVPSTAPLTVTLPKLVVAVGVTSKSGWATPLAELEHALSLPLLSTAVMRTKYVVLALRAVTRAETVCPDAGVVVGDDTGWNDPPGQVGSAVSRYMRYPARSVRGVPSAFVVGAFQVTVTEAASTLDPAATTARRMMIVPRSRTPLMAGDGVVEANSLLSPRACALCPIQALEISSAVATMARSRCRPRAQSGITGLCALDESGVDAGQEGCHILAMGIKRGEISPTPAEAPAHNVRCLTNASPAEQSARVIALTRADGGL